MRNRTRGACETRAARLVRLVQTASSCAPSENKCTMLGMCAGRIPPPQCSSRLAAARLQQTSQHPETTDRRGGLRVEGEHAISGRLGCARCQRRIKGKRRRSESGKGRDVSQTAEIFENIAIQGVTDITAARCMRVDGTRAVNSTLCARQRRARVELSLASRRPSEPKTIAETKNSPYLRVEELEPRLASQM